MPNDFKFDPATGDLISDGKGWFVTTPNADTMLQLQLECHYGECWHDETLGSRLFDLRFFQANPLVMLPDEVKRSLTVLQSRGRIDSIQVSATRVNAGRVDVSSKSRDTSTGQIVPTLTTLAAPSGS